MIDQENVKIPNIHAELKKLSENKEKQNQVRACLFNLVIYAYESRRTDYLREIYRIICKRFPCRIIFIIGEPQPDKDFLEVKVSQEVFEEGDRRIACDLINIKASLHHLSRIPYLVIPNLVPDLPVYLLWGQDPTTETEVLPKLVPYAQRLIFDSECSANLQNLSRKLLKSQSPLEMIDLNWASISSWRDVITGIYNTPDRIKNLQLSRKINISYNLFKDGYHQHSNIQSIYLQGWIAYSLNWKYISKEKVLDANAIMLIYHSEHGRIEVTLEGVRESEEISPGSITSVEITTYDESAFFARRLENEQKAVIHLSTADRCELPFTVYLPSLKRSNNFLKEVFYQPSGQHYHEMLKLIEHIDWLN